MMLYCNQLILSLFVTLLVVNNDTNASTVGRQTIGVRGANNNNNDNNNGSNSYNHLEDETFHTTENKFNVGAELDTTVYQLQDEINELVGIVDSLEERLLANARVIADLGGMNKLLNKMIELDLHSLDELRLYIDATESLEITQSLNYYLESGFSIDEDDTVTKSTYADRIIANNILVSALQEELDAIDDALILKRQLVQGACPEGQDIYMTDNHDGSVICEVNDPTSSSNDVQQLRAYNWIDVNTLYWTPATVSVSCPPGTILMGGGHSMYLPYGGNSESGPSVYDSHDFEHFTGRSWTAKGKVTHGGTTLYVTAVCLQFPAISSGRRDTFH